MSFRALVATIEARAEVPSMESLLARRRELVERVAKVRAVYGDGGTWKEHRDNLYALIAIQERERLEKEAPMVTDSKGVSKPRPVTEPMVDAAVRNTERYRDFIAKADVERAKWIVDENAIDDVTKMMYWLNALAKLRAGEPVL
jgi:hypothetical protein